MKNDSTEAIVAALTAWIGRAAPGARVPSNRELTALHGASPVTVQKAMRVLATRGLIESRPGIGTFVRAPEPSRPTDYGWQTAALRAPLAAISTDAAPLRSVAPDAIGLHAGYPDRRLLPEGLVHSALVRAARSDAAVTRPPAGGSPDLRAWFAAELARACIRGVAAPSARDVVVLPGSQSGLASLFRSLIGPGRPLLVESPTYWGATVAAAQAGVRLVPVPSGPAGPSPEDLDRAFEETGARLLYAQPSYANPTGAQWSPQQADEVLAVLRRHGAFMIEDDWAHDFGIDTVVQPVAARDDAGHVVYLRSLTKSVSPAVRIAAVIARGPARDRILADRGAESIYVSGLLQAAALDVVTQPAWTTHRRQLRHQLRLRRDLLADAVAAHLPGAYLEQLPPGGLNLWIRLPDAVDVARLVRDAEARGVVIAAGDEWFPAEPAGKFVRLNYSGPDPERFDEAARVIGSALEEQLA